MSTIAFKALLIREINQAMDEAQAEAEASNNYSAIRSSWYSGMVDAYAHVLQLIQEDDT